LNLCHLRANQVHNLPNNWLKYCIHMASETLSDKLRGANPSTHDFRVMVLLGLLPNSPGFLGLYPGISTWNSFGGFEMPLYFLFPLNSQSFSKTFALISVSSLS